MTALRPSVAAIALVLTLAACRSGEAGTAPAAATVQRAASYDVQRCLDQVVPGTGGRTVTALVVPDVITIDLNAASGFPNGRRLADPVIDVTLAAIFVDMTKQSPMVLANLPLNPAANDVPFPAGFPYLAPAQGTPPLSPTTGTNFNFRSDPVSAYTRVDRMGMPAVATALVASGGKNAYNDADPSVDATNAFTTAVALQLTNLTNALEDDIIALGVTPCATKIG